jgi:hypothetical protein
MMRPPRVRFTVRRMMIAELVVAILIGVGLQVEGLFVSLDSPRALLNSRLFGASMWNLIAKQGNLAAVGRWD